MSKESSNDAITIGFVQMCISNGTIKDLGAMQTKGSCLKATSLTDAAAAMTAHVFHVS